MVSIFNFQNGKEVNDRAAAQVSVRRVKAGLGGHDDGVSGVEEGVENTSFPISKQGRLALSECPTFNGFKGIKGDFRSETKNGLEETVEIRRVLVNCRCIVTSLSSCNQLRL